MPARGRPDGRSRSRAWRTRAIVHRLTRGRLWIGALATLLVGIVALNVLALSFNASAEQDAASRPTRLKREISALRAQDRDDGRSNAAVQAEAAKLGLIVPSRLDPLPAPIHDAAVAERSPE